jgi:hypothetical protein
MTTRSGLFCAWCAQAWRRALLTTQAMAGYDLTGQLGDWGPPQDPVVPVERIPCTPGADEAPMVSTEDQSDAVPEPLRVFTPVEWVIVRLLERRLLARAKGSAEGRVERPRRWCYAGRAGGPCRASTCSARWCGAAIIIRSMARSPAAARWHNIGYRGEKGAAPWTEYILCSRRCSTLTPGAHTGTSAALYGM